MEAQRVLVVDDEKRLTAFLEDFLAKRGYRMRVALSGEEALKAVEAQQPALMVLDMRMPGVDGVQVLKTVKERYPHIKVIVMTSFDEEYQQAAKQYRADAFFVKPLGLAELTRKIEELLQPQDPTAQAAVLTAPPDMIPKAKLLFVSPVPLGSMLMIEAVHCVGEGSLEDEDVDYPDAGLYEWEEVVTHKEAMTKLEAQGFDFVFIHAGWEDREVHLFGTKETKASDLVAEMLHSKYAPKEIFLFSGALPEPRETRTQEEKALELGGSVIQAPTWGDLDTQAAKINRLLWERCQHFGLMTKRPPPFTR